MPAANAPSWNTARILWAALLSSIMVYVVILQVGDVVDPTVEPTPELLPALGFAALATAAVSLWLPRNIFTTALRSRDIAVEEAPDPNSSVMFRDRGPTIRVFANPQDVERTVLQLYMTPLILGLALSEAVALYGFVLGVMGFPFTTVLPFFVAGAVLIAIRFPRPVAVRARVETILDARFPPE